MSGAPHLAAATTRFRLTADAADPPQRHVVVLAYDGSAYSGWQIQPRAPSIQGRIEQALTEITGFRVRVHASGRTDAGVHARAQPAHFDLPVRPDPSRLMLGLNAVLPADIRVLSLRRVPAAFHARYACRSKEYRYFIHNRPVLDPFRRRYAAWERRPLDVAAMQRAAARLVGRHDFAAFSANPNREIGGTARHLSRLDVRRRGGEIVIAAEADGFLYRMVRSLAGFLIRVGRGEIAPEAAAEILDSKVRTARVPTAPPQGLFLWRVRYDAAAFRKGAFAPPRPGG